MKPVIFFLSFLAILLSTGCAEKVPLSVTNGLENYNIYCVYISRETDTVWGSNHLPGTDVLGPGKTAEVLVMPGVYDIQVSDEDGDTYTLRDVDVEPGGFSWTVTLEDIDTASPGSDVNLPNAGQCPVTLTNDLNNWDIQGVWISSSTGEDWGSNHIDGAILYPGDTYTAYVQADTYDIYIEDEDGDTYTRWSIIIDESGYSWGVTLDDIDSSGG